jgi:type I restriction enzyme, S subunit
MIQRWKFQALGKIAEVQSGGTPLRSQSEYWSGEIPWYSSGELNDAFTRPSKDFITQKGLEGSNAKIFPKGSLLIGVPVHRGWREAWRTDSVRKWKRHHRFEQN